MSLSELIRRTRRVVPEADARQVRDLTLRVVHHALSRGEAQAGQFTPDSYEFQVWKDAPEEIVRRVDDEWQALGGPEPNVGEVMWLRAPE